MDGSLAPERKEYAIQITGIAATTKTSLKTHVSKKARKSYAGTAPARTKMKPVQVVPKARASVRLQINVRIGRPASIGMIFLQR